MNEASPRSGSPVLVLALGVLCAAFATGACGYVLYQQNQKIEVLAAAVNAREADLKLMLGEITRIRLEQTTGQQGPQALLSRLKTYAPLLASAMTAQPDYAMARKEMDAVLRAFAAMGEQAWPPIVARMDELKGDKDFEELKWLLEAAVRVDKPAALLIVKAVLEGTKFPAPRLRWYAARILIDLDKPVAQTTLRRIMTTESFRGIDMERAAAYGRSIIDPAAIAQNGFSNFVQYYVLSEDPQIDETLLMVIGRAGHDMSTIQECIEHLGKRGCARAAEPIRKLFLHPPGAQQEPIFQTKCLDAIAAIEGEKARPFFEAELPKATTEKVANHLKSLLSKPIEKATMAAAVQTPNSIAPAGKK